MRRVIVSSLILALCLGSADDVWAKKSKKRASRSSKRASKVKSSSSSTSSSSTTSDTVRAGRTTSSTSSSSSSSTDISSSTHRFIADSMTYDTKLKYDVKYDVGEMLLPSVLTYYKTNGSEGINEKLCFGPYMTLTGMSASGEVMTKTAEAGFECEPLLATYSYTLELKEASKATLDKFAYPRRVRIVRSDVDVAYMQFNYENYVDVSDYVPKIVKAVADAKSSCSSLSGDMEKLKSSLGWSTGLSAGGLVLSAGATGVGVYNVIKTNDLDGKLKRKEVLDNKEASNIDEKLWKDASCSEDEQIDIAKEVKAGGIKDKKLACLKDARTRLQTEVDTKGKNLVFDKGKAEKEISRVNAEYNKFVFEMYNNLVWDGKGEKITSCKICEVGEDYKCKDGTAPINNDFGRCNSLVVSYGFPYKSKDEFEKAREAKNKTLSEEASKKQVEIWNGAEKDPRFRQEDKDYSEYVNKLDVVDKQIAAIEEVKSAKEQKEKLNGKIMDTAKTSRMLDWVQAGLNAGSFLTSGGSLIFSVSAVSTASKAMDSLSDCESKINNLKLLYNGYKAEVESYGDEE